MMLLLVFNITKDLFNNGFADGEGRIAGLPCKLFGKNILFIYKVRATALDLFNNVGNGFLRVM